MWDFLKSKKKVTNLGAEQKKSWRLWRRNLVRSQEAISEEARVATSQLEQVYESQLKEAGARMEEKFNQAIEVALTSFTKDLYNYRLKEEEKAKADVEAYKIKAIAAVSQKAAAVLAQVTKIVLRRSLTSQDQEDLILEALDQAKKEEFLS